MKQKTKLLIMNCLTFVYFILFQVVVRDWELIVVVENP